MQQRINILVKVFELGIFFVIFPSSLFLLLHSIWHPRNSMNNKKKFLFQNLVIISSRIYPSPFHPGYICSKKVLRKEKKLKENDLCLILLCKI